MSKNWAVILVATTFLSVGTMLGTLIAPRPLEAAKEPESPAPARIAFVNIAKVLREFKKANKHGEIINAKRQVFIDKIKPLKEMAEAKAKKLKSADIPDAKERLEKEGVKLQREIEDLEREAQQVLGEMTDRSIVEVYKNIHEVIADLAKERRLDVVECYPDASNPEDAMKPAIAQLKLQTPALIPYYARKELLITDDVIELLNKKFPFPKVVDN